MTTFHAYLIVILSHNFFVILRDNLFAGMISIFSISKTVLARRIKSSAAKEMNDDRVMLDKYQVSKWKKCKRHDVSGFCWGKKREKLISWVNRDSNIFLQPAIMRLIFETLTGFVNSKVTWELKHKFVNNCNWRHAYRTSNHICLLYLTFIRW